MKAISVIIVPLVLASCGASPFMPQDGIELADIDGGDEEYAMENFETLERLRDNPVDPRTAKVEELLSIPGFPEPLARRVVGVSRERGRGRSWIEALTPPERSQLYRYRTYVILPERQPTSLRARITGERLGSRDMDRTDCHSTLAGDGWKALVRSRELDLDRRTSFYAFATAPSGALRLHAGSFVPDFAFGLVFDGCVGSYPFSGAYPFHGSRWIAGSTSFYGHSLLGGVAELWHRNMKAVFLAGRERVFKSDHFEIGESELLGGRLGLTVGSWETGLCAFKGAGARERTIYSIDARWRSECIGVGFEIVGVRIGDPACALGLSYRAGKTRCGILLHAVPPDISGPFGRINARPLEGAVSHRGVASVVESEVPAGIRVRAAFERYARANGFSESAKDMLRAECERGWRRMRLRISWVSRVEGISRLIPFPGETASSRNGNASWGILSAIGIRAWLAGNISTRYSAGNGHKGILFSHTLTVSSFSGRIKAVGSIASFRALKGAPLLYFNEPSLEGAYPWIAVSGNGERSSFLIVFNLKWLSLSSKVVFKARRAPEAGVQAVLNLG